MAEKKKFPNPQFFRARNNMDLKKQAENLKEVGAIALDLIKETDWKAFAAKQKDHLLDNVARVTREAKTIAAMTGAERMDLLKNGEKHLGTLYRKGDMATVRREWRGVESTLIDFSGWLKVWGMLLATFSKDLVPALNTTFWYLLYVLRGLHGQEHHGPAGQRPENEPSDDPRYFPLCGGKSGIPGQVRREERQQC